MKMANPYQSCNRLLAALCLVSPLGFAQGITVGDGATVNLGDGSLSLNCNNLTINQGATMDLGAGVVDGISDFLNGGMLDGGSARLEFTGAWRQTGSFTAGSGSVNLVDGCGKSISRVRGESTFHDFSVVTGIPRLVIFTAERTNRVDNALSLRGDAAGMLTLRSSISGTLTNLHLEPTGTQSIAFVDVADVQATGQPLAPGDPTTYQSIDSGNNPGWFGEAPSPVIFRNGFE